MGHKGPRKTLKLRPEMKVGEAAAEDDPLLYEAFLDKGDLKLLRDTQRRESIVVGRTGSGKTALLRIVEEEEANTIRINPEELSIRYLIASSIIPSLHNAGIHLEPFYKQMWKHIIVVELIKKRFHITTENQQRSFWANVASWVSSSKKKEHELIKYAQDHGGKFWESTETQITQIAQELRSRVEANLSAELKGVLKAGLTGEEEESVKLLKANEHRVQTAVSQAKLDYLARVFKLIEDRVFDDPQKPYFVLLDDLDKNWVERAYAYDLLNALFHVVGEINRVHNVKIIVALRENILERLYNLTIGRPGQQREKFETFILRVRWTPEELRRVLERRVRALMKKEYGQSADLGDVLPQGSPRGSKRQEDALEYLISRTLLRPRDLISFFNQCLSTAGSTSRIRWRDMYKAERSFSRDRYYSLVEEWSENHPRLREMLDALTGMKDGFTAETVEWARIESMLVQAADEMPPVSEPAIWYHAWVANRLSQAEITTHLLQILLKIGAVGAKRTPGERVLFSYEDPEILERRFFGGGVRYYFHPSLYRALDVREPLRGE